MGPKLVEIEDVGSKDEIVGDLLNLDFGSGGDITKIYHGVRFTVSLDVRVNLCLYFRIPDLPVALTHCVVLVFFLAPREGCLPEGYPSETNHDCCEKYLSHYCCFYKKGADTTPAPSPQTIN